MLIGVNQLTITFFGLQYGFLVRYRCSKSLDLKELVEPEEHQIRLENQGQHLIVKVDNPVFDSLPGSSGNLDCVVELVEIDSAHARFRVEQVGAKLFRKPRLCEGCQHQKHKGATDIEDWKAVKVSLSLSKVVLLHPDSHSVKQVAIKDAD